MTDTTQASVETDGNDTAAVLAALEGDKTYIEPAKAETDAGSEATEEKDDLGDDAPAATDEGQAETPKPKKTAQERIDEVTRARRDAERDAEYWKAKALSTASAQPAQAAPDIPEDTHPVRADYDNDDDYIDDLTTWKADEAVERRLAIQRQRDQATAAVTTFETQAKALFPTGEPEGLTAFKRIEQLPATVIEVIGISDVGPKLAEHLGNNPAEIERMWSMSPTQIARELTLIETRLSQPAVASNAIVTNAPEPPPRVRGGGGQFKVSGDTDDFAAFENQYRVSG